MAENEDKSLYNSPADTRVMTASRPAPEIDDEDYDDVEDQVMFLYVQLMNTPYSKINIISDIERSLYQEIGQDPDDYLALIAFMQVQTMLGNHDKAKAFAYKIWENGSQLEDMEEYLYINNLLNLGLLDMASVLLKPRLENLLVHIENFYPLMLKIAVMTGNSYLIERLAANPNAPEDDSILLGIITRYKNYNYLEHFKTVQKTILDTLKDNLCSYDYAIETGVFNEISVSLYVNGDSDEVTRLNNALTEKLNAYYAASNIDKMSNFNWQIKSVITHPAEGLDI